MSIDSTLTDPVALLRTLDVEAIKTRLDELEEEAAALRVLLRSANARRTGRRRHGAGRPQNPNDSANRLNTNSSATTSAEVQHAAS